MNRNNARRHPGKPGPRPDLTDLKRSEAKERQAAWDALSSDEKVARLDAKLGKNVGAKKQREKLSKNKPIKVEATNEDRNIVSALSEETSGKKKIKAKDRRKQQSNSEVFDDEEN